MLFLFAVQLLGTATDAAAPVLRTLMRQIVVGDASALGLGWLGAYALANGSVVAALALSLFTADLLSATQLFVTVAGSRLGGAGVVVFIGALDFFQKRRFSLQESVSMGLLTFLLTLAIYLPVTLLGYASLPLVLAGASGDAGPTMGFRPFGVFEPVAAAITDALGPGLAVLLAVGILFASLQLFDRLLSAVDTATLRDRFFSHFARTWVSFGIGLFVTGATTSVAFSLGMIVPLYNRGYVKRDELVPYVLGANIGTFADTVVVALVLESPIGLTVVLYLVAVATMLTLLALLVYEPFSRAVLGIDDLLLEDRRAFLVFVCVLALVPLGLVLVPLALAG